MAGTCAAPSGSTNKCSLATSRRAGMQLVEGQVAVVTGAGSGIGLGMARAFADHGLRVVLADVRSDALDDAVAGLRASGSEAIGVTTDVSKRADVERLA